MIPESQLRSARTHSTYKESLPEDELQEFEQQIMMVEKYLRRVGAMRRSENVALLLEKNSHHRHGLH